MLSVNGHSISTDKEGYLKNLEDWSPEVAEALAQECGIDSLTDAHWEVIHLLQRFYQQFKISPAMRPLVKSVKQELGDAKGSSIYLMQLFPQSPAKVASKIAGLPRPTNCL